MSPLIATVLLMAFAVALGGMIMNWSLDMSTNSECDAIDIHVTQFCTQGNSILLRMQSSGESAPLQGVRLDVLSDSIEQSINVRGSELEPSNPLALDIPFAVPGDARVELIGVVGPKAEPFACKDRPIERVEPIKPC
jgi:hypothetical protein